MKREEAYELEEILVDLEQYDDVFIKRMTARVKEITLPIILNEKDKEAKQKLKLKFSYRNFTPSTEIQRAIGALSNAISFYEEAQTDITTLQHKQQDILHALELTDMDDAELTNLMRELKEIRLLRRQAKNFQDAVEPLYRYALKNRSTVKDLGKIQNETLTIQKEIEQKKYFVREKTSLAEAFEQADSFSNRIEQLSLQK